MDALSRINGANGKVAVTDFEAAVLQRYGDAAQEVEQCLCLPVSYDKGLLGVIPQEIIDKDYGCGDPSRYVRQGETVLDLGSGSGKGCYSERLDIGHVGYSSLLFRRPSVQQTAHNQKRSLLRHFTALARNSVSASPGRGCLRPLPFWGAGAATGDREGSDRKMA